MTRVVAALGLAIASALLLFGAAIAAIVSAPLALALLGWSVATIASIFVVDRRRHDRGLVGFALASGVVAVLLGTLTRGTAEIMLPTSALFALGALAIMLDARQGRPA